MSKRERLLKLIDYYSGGNKSVFAAKLGMKPQGINSWLTRNTFNTDLIYSKCDGISAEWLVAGKGHMLRDGTPAPAPDETHESTEQLHRPESSTTSVDHIYKKVVSKPSKDMILEIIRMKDEELREQAIEIGRLRERIQLIQSGMQIVGGGKLPNPPTQMPPAQAAPAPTPPDPVPATPKSASRPRVKLRSASCATDVSRDVSK